MTRREFLEQAAKEVNFLNLKSNREDYLEHFREYSKFNANPKFVFDFLYGDGFNGDIKFTRFEKKSDDILHISICCASDHIDFWEDIGQHVCIVAYIRNCTCCIEKFYLSEDGRFWDEHHKQRFETENELFDYLLVVEYDFHPVITEKTYEMLRYFGWYEGRCVDTSEFEREIKKYKITLSKVQLDVMREFSGLTFNFSICDWNQEFYTFEEMIERIRGNDLDFETEVYDFHSKRLIGKNVFEFGSDDQNFFSIAEDGKIFRSGVYPIGRTVLEYIYAFGDRLPKNVRWL